MKVFDQQRMIIVKPAKILLQKPTAPQAIRKRKDALGRLFYSVALSARKSVNAYSHSIINYQVKAAK